jgi:hypothetical protein
MSSKSQDISLIITHIKGVNEIQMAKVQAIRATFLTKFLNISTQDRKPGTIATKVAEMVRGSAIATANAAHHPTQITVSQIDQ